MVYLLIMRPIVKLLFKAVIFVVLAVVGFTIFSNVFQDSKVKVVDQTMLTETDSPAMVISQAVEKRSGSFTEIDLVHRGSGQALVLETKTGPLLQLDNFKVTPGPDLFVYLSKNQDIKNTKDLGEFISLGKLKSSRGNQQYALPEDYQDYHSVVIWCRAFGVLFSVAELR